MFVIFFLPLFLKDLTLQSLSASLVSIQGLLCLILIFTSGGIYYIVDLRKYFFRKSIHKIDENIKTKLINICNNDPEVQSVNGELRRNRTLMHIFYHFIDNDESLKDKANDVRLNGLILSSLSDLAIISLLMIVIYLPFFIVVYNAKYLLLTAISVFAFVISKLFIPKVTKKHISLSDEQLEFIELKYKDDLQQKLKDIARGLTKSDK
jgi:hypothetical protein